MRGLCNTYGRPARGKFRTNKTAIMAALIRLLIFGKVRAENFAISVRKTNFRVLKYDRILNRIRNTSRAPLLRVIFAINHVYLVNQIKSSEYVIDADKIANRYFFRAL